MSQSDRAPVHRPGTNSKAQRIKAESRRCNSHLAMGAVRDYVRKMTQPAVFHPAVEAWFRKTFPAPTEAQARAWPAIQARRHVLVAAPTGSGETLAAVLAAVDSLVRPGV